MSSDPSADGTDTVLVGFTTNHWTDKDILLLFTAREMEGDTVLLWRNVRSPLPRANETLLTMSDY